MLYIYVVASGFGWVSMFRQTSFAVIFNMWACFINTTGQPFAVSDWLVLNVMIELLLSGVSKGSSCPNNAQTGSIRGQRFGPALCRRLSQAVPVETTGKPLSLHDSRGSRLTLSGYRKGYRFSPARRYCWQLREIRLTSPLSIEWPASYVVIGHREPSIQNIHFIFGKETSCFYPDNDRIIRVVSF